MKFDLIPHSRATNSYDLFEDVIAAIDAEPKRFDWANWFVDGDDPHDLRNANTKLELPACGTLACVAGWVNLLTATNERQPITSAYGSSAAQRWFPESVRFDLYRLFIPMAHENDINPKYGESRREYANRGIAAIRKFMDTHRDALKMHTITIPAREV